MENWGLIGFTSSYLLFDPEKTSDSLKQDVCETVTHELAHQVSQGTGSPSSQYEELLCVFFYFYANVQRNVTWGIYCVIVNIIYPVRVSRFYSQNISRIDFSSKTVRVPIQTFINPNLKPL